MRITLNLPMELLLQDSDVAAWIQQTSQDFRPNQYQVKIETFRTILSIATGERAVYFTLRYLRGGQVRFSRQFKAVLGSDAVLPA